MGQRLKLGPSGQVDKGLGQAGGDEGFLSKIFEESEMENWVLVDRLVRDWNTLMGMKGCCPNCSEGSVVDSWVLMDRLGRDWNTLFGMKGSKKI